MYWNDVKGSVKLRTSLAICMHEAVFKCGMMNCVLLVKKTGTSLQFKFF